MFTGGGFPLPLPRPLGLGGTAGGVAGAGLLVGSAGMKWRRLKPYIYIPLRWWDLVGARWVFNLDMFIPFKPGVGWVFVFLRCFGLLG